MFHSIFGILADAAPAAGAPGGTFNPSNLVYLLFFGVMIYFLMFRPQNLRQKEQDAMIKAIKTGDKIVTSSGIHGMVSNVKDSTIIVKIADNVKIELDKSSVGSVKRDESDAAAS